MEIRQVHEHPLIERDVAAAAGLPDAGDPRDDLEALKLKRVAGVGFFDDQRARADEGHIAFEHVPKLRKFIKARRAEESAKDGEARIIADLKNRPVELI